MRGWAIGLAGGVLVQAGAAYARPDWTGVWVVAGGDMDRQDGRSLGSGPSGTRGGGGAAQRPPPPSFKGDYKLRADARQAAVRAAAAEGAPLPFQGDGGCKAGPLDGGFWSGPYAFEIVAAQSQIVISQEFLQQVRRVYLDGRPHPSPDHYDATVKGHSVGRWDGDVLAIDTVGIRVDDQTYSDRLHVSERIWSSRPDYLTIAVTTTDPEALAAPWRVEYSLHRKPGMEIQDYDCTENNRNPTGPDGRTQTVLKEPAPR